MRILRQVWNSWFVGLPFRIKTTNMAVALPNIQCHTYLRERIKKGKKCGCFWSWSLWGCSKPASQACGLAWILETGGKHSSDPLADDQFCSIAISMMRISYSLWFVSLTHSHFLALIRVDLHTLDMYHFNSTSLAINMFRAMMNEPEPAWYWKKTYQIGSVYMQCLYDRVCLIQWFNYSSRIIVFIFMAQC